MSDIAPIGRPNLPAVNGHAAHGARVNGSAHAPTRGGDRVELSSAAQLLGKLRGLPEVRADLVARVRAQIDAGTYETDARIDAAVDALAEDLG